MGDRFERAAASVASVLPVRIIAAAEVVAGAYGVLTFLNQARQDLFISHPAENARSLFLLLLATLLALNTLCVVAGVMLWRGSRHGALLSAAVQWAQLLQVYSPSFTYVFVVGAALSLYIPWPRLGFMFTYGSQSRISINAAAEVPVACAVNLVAVAALMVLVWHQNQLDEGRDIAGPSV